MAEKVQWFIEQGDGSVIFMNGHIGKVNFTPNYDCLGNLLAKELGDGYFAIGTDAKVTAFTFLYKYSTDYDWNRSKGR